MPDSCILHIAFDLPPNAIWGMGNAVYSLAKAQSDKYRICIGVPHRGPSPDAPPGVGDLQLPHLSIVRQNVPMANLQTDPKMCGCNGVWEALSWNNGFTQYLISRLSAMDLHPEVVHFHGWMMFPASVAVAKHFQCPLIYTAHTVEGYYSLDDISGLSGSSNDVEAMILEKSDGVIAPSQSARDALALRYRLAREGFHVIPNALTDGLSGAGPSVPFSQRPNHIAWVGRIIRHKGIVEALDLFARLGLARRGWRLRVIGDGPDLTPVQEAYRAAEGVLFLGRRSNADVFSDLRNSKVFLSLSRFETFGMSVSEAMYSGCCVVTGKGPAVASLVEHGVNGFTIATSACSGLYPSGTCRELADLFDDDDRMARLGLAAKSYAASTFDPHRIAVRHLALYRQVAARRPQRFGT